jgi:hypothetical protein
MKKPTLKYATSEGFVMCVTCLKVIPWTEAQASHFIDGRGNAILFEERGVHPCCYACNVCKHGNKVEYFRFMQEKYGDKVIDELRILAKQPKKYTVDDYLEIYERCNKYVEKKWIN